MEKTIHFFHIVLLHQLLDSRRYIITIPRKTSFGHGTRLTTLFARKNVLRCNTAFLIKCRRIAATWGITKLNSHFKKFVMICQIRRYSPRLRWNVLEFHETLWNDLLSYAKFLRLLKCWRIGEAMVFEHDLPIWTACAGTRSEISVPREVPKVDNFSGPVHR